MIRAAFRFYATCLLRAFKGKLSLALSVTGAIAAFASAAVWALSPPASVEHFLTADLPGIVLLGALATTVVFGFLVAPFELHLEGERRRAALEARLAPRLELTLPETGTVDANLSGRTIEAVSGRRQTYIQRSLPDVVCLQCKNVGEVTIHAARARLLAATRQSPDGTDLAFRMVEPVELAWTKEDLAGSFSIDIAPNETRRVWIGWVHSTGRFSFLRRLDSLPIDYQTMFGAAGRFRILMQVDGDDSGPI